MTLRFFESLQGTDKEALLQELPRLAQSLAPVTVRVERLGFFGTPARPRVLWVGPDQPSPALVALSTSVRESFPNPAGERRFVPHLTLARFRGRLSAAHRQVCAPHLSELKRGRERGRLPDWARFGPVEERVEELSLFVSRASSEGPRYLRVASVPFG